MVQAHLANDRTLLKLALSSHDCAALLEMRPLIYIAGNEKSILRMIPCDLEYYHEQIELYTFQRPNDVQLAKKYGFGRPRIRSTKQFFVYLPQDLLTKDLTSFFDVPIVPPAPRAHRYHSQTSSEE